MPTPESSLGCFWAQSQLGVGGNTKEGARLPWVGGRNGRSGIPELGGRGCHTVFLALPEAQIFHCLTILGFTEVHTFPAASGAQGQPLSYLDPYCLLSQSVSVPSRCHIFLTVSPSGTSANLRLNSGKTSYMHSRPQGRKELIHLPSSGNKRIHPLSPGSKRINHPPSLHSHTWNYV